VAVVAATPACSNSICHLGCWIHLIADIEDWAKDQGAIRLKMTARKGYPKRFKELFASYKMTHVLLEKDL
jgi:hypothetical protein